MRSPGGLYNCRRFTVAEQLAAVTCAVPEHAAHGGAGERSTHTATASPPCPSLPRHASLAAFQAAQAGINTPASLSAARSWFHAQSHSSTPQLLEGGTGQGLQPLYFQAGQCNAEQVPGIPEGQSWVLRAEKKKFFSLKKQSNSNACGLKILPSLPRALPAPPSLG